MTLRDHVHLLGYRGQIELIGRDLGLHGIVFNAPDGSVRSLLKAEKIFLNDLKKIREGVDIETKRFQETHMKRFDRGIELLTGIDHNTRLLVDSQYKLPGGQDKSVEGQNKISKGQYKMITLLEKIESKLK
ncbi:MAG TPA: hypothetical protein HA257_08565 [Candidatus Methanoperedenaceae archaeon]|nr:hypothetical protein [Candidatus Methanoperedenaceae archaeon]